MSATASVAEVETAGQTTGQGSCERDCVSTAAAEATSDATAQMSTQDACHPDTETDSTGTETITEGTTGDHLADRQDTNVRSTDGDHEEITQIHQGKITHARRWVRVGT